MFENDFRISDKIPITMFKFSFTTISMGEAMARNCPSQLVGGRVIPPAWGGRSNG